MQHHDVKCDWSERTCLRGYWHLKSKGKPYRKVTFSNMTEQLQTDYLVKYESVQADINQKSVHVETSSVSATYLYFTHCKILLDSGTT